MVRGTFGSIDDTLRTSSDGSCLGFNRGKDIDWHGWVAFNSPPPRFRLCIYIYISFMFPRVMPYYSRILGTTRKFLVKPATRTLSHWHATQTIPQNMARQLTDADRARAQAYLDAMQDAMAAIPEYNPDHIQAACKEVARAHPIDDALREAYSAELLNRMADPVSVSHVPSNFLKLDAPWGLVVYRGSYSNDAAWERMLVQIRHDVDTALQGQQEQAQRHDLVTMDDRSRFDGAGPDQVRHHFNDWAVDELQRNWSPGTRPPSKDALLNATGNTDYLDQSGPRYNFCLFIDDVCLESLDKMAIPVVKLINRRWTQGGERQQKSDADDGNPGWEGGVTNNEFEDVGWMYVHVCDYVDVQSQLEDGDNWADVYVRPPLMRFETEFKDAHGFWRYGSSLRDGTEGVS
ncbi:unnamed protein product [Clonostachys solani]|uniref:Uncharacterized protein n=1 Tax=Clonostachys solani TaxID=160281 RepID=A0A9N9Z0K8_9HYPO|nr:unnamed protein product [Clonostachys solani]